MSDAALEEVSVLSSIYCGEGEFQFLRQSSQDGIVIQINCTVGGGRGHEVSLLFHLTPAYPSHPPDISVSSPGLSRTRCHSIRQKLLDQAADLPPEPMVHQLVQSLQQQCEEVTDDHRGSKDSVKDEGREEVWTLVLLLDHIRSRSRYIGLLQRWSKQLCLTGRVVLGHRILVVLLGVRADIKKFCHQLKTAKVDVDSSGRKCKERMMKVLVESPSSSSCPHSVQGLAVRTYQSSSELAAVFQELHMSELYQQILPSLGD